MPNIDKIVFLHEHHFSEYYLRIFGIQFLLDEGYDVEVWCFMPFLTTVEYQKHVPTDSMRWNKYREFLTTKEAIEAIIHLSESSVVMSGIHYTPRTLGIYRALAKKGVPCFSLLAMALPLGTKNKSTIWTRRIKQLIRKDFQKKVWEAIFYRIPFRLLGVNPVDVIIAMGEKYFRGGYPNNKQSKVLWVHFFDYDIYLREKALPYTVDEKIGVFLDEYLPFHPDNVALGYPAVPPDEYYRLIRNFFDRLEINTGVRIIIAAHPRSRYDEKEGLFGQRKIIRGRTAELVKKAGFVILHQSMSLNFAILFEKPMIFITTDKVNEYLIEDPTPAWLARFFGKKLHNLNRTINIDYPVEIVVNKRAYSEYKNAYIKKDGSPDYPYWSIVIDYIKRLSTINE